MYATDSTFAFLSWPLPGAYQSGAIAQVLGLIIAVVATYLARGRLWPRDRLVASAAMLALSVALIAVLAVKIHEIVTWSAVVTGETATPAPGLFFGAACVAAAAIGSAISFYAALVGYRRTPSGRGLDPAVTTGGPVPMPATQR